MQAASERGVERSAENKKKAALRTSQKSKE